MQQLAIAAGQKLVNRGRNGGFLTPRLVCAAPLTPKESKAGPIYPGAEYFFLALGPAIMSRKPRVNSPPALLFKSSNLFLGACLDTIVVSFPGFFCSYSFTLLKKRQQVCSLGCSGPFSSGGLYAWS